MTKMKPLELAIAKAAQLAEQAREQIAREVLWRVEALGELRSEIEIGLRQLDDRLGEELDVAPLELMLASRPTESTRISSGRFLS